MRTLLASFCVGLVPAAAALLRAGEQLPPRIHKQPPSPARKQPPPHVVHKRPPPRAHERPPPHVLKKRAQETWNSKKSSSSARPRSNLFHQGGRAEEDDVCISVSAYEDTEWIDALLANADKFTERSTKIALHLDSKTQYDEADLNRWDSDKVVVTPERVGTEKFHGGILYSHLLNAKALARKWPRQCRYFVMAASNMMWVRSGMEPYVREHQMVQLTNMTCDFNTYICDHPLLLEIMGGDRNMVAWSQPEGLFLPMALVLEFSQYLDDFLRQNQWNITTQLVDEKGHYEEFWLQTWARNKHPDVVAMAKKGRPAALSLRMLGDGVTMEQVQQVMSGKPPHSGQFAVKRVNRDFTFPTTKYILSLSHETV